MADGVRPRSRSPRADHDRHRAVADILEDPAVACILAELRKFGGDTLRREFQYNISDPQPHGRPQGFQGISKYIGMLRCLDIADRTIGIILYYHTRLDEPILRYSWPALEAGLQLRLEAATPERALRVWQDDYFPWRATHNLSENGIQTWSLRVLKQLCHRCDKIAKNPRPPPMPPLVREGEGVCVQCGSFCSSMCGYCRGGAAFLCEKCALHNFSYYPEVATSCMAWKHHYAVAGRSWL